MKKLKLAIVAAILIGITIMACNKSKVEPSNNSLSSQSNDIALSDFVFLAIADTSNNTHQNIQLLPIDVEALPVAITTYITTNFSGSTIEKAANLSNGVFVVRVLKSDASRVCLVFSATGVFIEQKPMKEPKASKIDIDKLPAQAKSYISTNYASSTTLVALLTTGGDYAAILLNTDGTKSLLGFTNDGTFKTIINLDGSYKNKAAVIAIADLPSSITSYINSNYAGAIIIEARKGQFGNYAVLINQSNNIRLLIAFGSDGKFIGILPNK